MAFVLFKNQPGRKRQGPPSDRAVCFYATRNPRLGRFVLYDSTLHSVGFAVGMHVQVMVDEVAKEIAMMPAQPTAQTYKLVRDGHSGGAALCAGRLVRHLGLSTEKTRFFELEPAPELGEGAWKFSYAEAVGG
jgi:hypothetical protein